MRAAFGMALLGIFALGGCGQSDAQIRDELRAQMMNRCATKIAPSTADLPGFNSDAYCRCVTDKAFGDRSLAELKTLFDESRREEMTAQGRQAGAECLAQQNGNALDRPAAAGTAETGNSAAPAPAAERERPAEKAEPAAPRPPRAEEPAPRPSVRVDPEPRRAAPRPEPEPGIDDEEEEPSDAA